jgi:hypothetical protein
MHSFFEDIKQLSDFSNFIKNNVITDKVDNELSESIALSDFIHKLYYKNRFFNEKHVFFNYVQKLLVWQLLL